MDRKISDAYAAKYAKRQIEKAITYVDKLELINPLSITSIKKRVKQ